MGSLNQYLSKNSNLSRQSILTIIKGTAAGLLHLHQEKIGNIYIFQIMLCSLQTIYPFDLMLYLGFCLLVHRDIAARNVLLQMVDSNIVAKIGDFVST